MRQASTKIGRENTEKSRARWRAIIARTTAGRAALDAIINAPDHWRVGRYSSARSVLAFPVADA